MKNSVKNLIIGLFLIAFASAASAQQATIVPEPVATYLQLKDALFKADQKLASEKAAILNTWFDTNSNAKGWEKQSAKVKKSAAQIAAATDVNAQRKNFADLSAAFIAAAKGTPQAAALYVQYCPMKKASWLSLQKDIQNPYYGSQMASCGSVTETIAASTK